MKKKFLDKMEKLLINQKNELMGKTYHSYTIDGDGDETDTVQASLLDSINVHLTTRDLEKVNLIDKALGKITANLYGSCESCGEDIAEKRLELMPHCLICVLCAEQAEHEAKQRSRK